MTQEIYNIGDTIWIAKYQNEKVMGPCPVCFGELEITVVLGDDSQVVAPCNYCSQGFGPPTGEEVISYAYVTSAQERTITGVRTDTNRETGELEVTYWFGMNGMNGDSCAVTHDEAVAIAQVQVDRMNERREQKREYAKEKAHKSYAWHVGYHNRCAKKAKDDLEHHEQKAKYMQSKAR